MDAQDQRMVDRYLKDLRRELRDVPKGQAEEMIAEVRAHISESLAGEGAGDDVRTVLDRVGDPATIAAEARERLDVHPVPVGGLEVAVLVLLAIGGFVIPVFGWVAGVVLLWISEAWSSREKVIGTIIGPASIFLALMLFLFARTGIGLAELSILGAVLAFAAGGAISALYLGLRMRKRAGHSDETPVRRRWLIPSIVLVALLVVGGIAWALSGRSVDVPAGYQKVGTVGGQTLWAMRSTHAGQPRVSLMTTGSMGGMCNGGGPYGDYRLAICDGGVPDVGYIIVVPVTPQAHTVDTKSGNPSFTILAAPRGWPYSFAMAVGDQQDLPTLGRLEVLDSKGQSIPPAKAAGA